LKKNSIFSQKGISLKREEYFWNHLSWTYYTCSALYGKNSIPWEKIVSEILDFEEKWIRKK
jgi:hypothetical protein